MTSQQKTSYCIDSSALLELRSLDADVFKGIWEVLDDLVLSGSIHAPKEVLREVAHLDSATARWAKSKSGFFLIPDQSLLDKVTEVQSKFKFFDPEIDKPKADPFLVAHSILTGCTIVTQETFNKKCNAGPKIPEACTHFGCKYINLSELFREQGWTFVSKKS